VAASFPIPALTDMLVRQVSVISEASPGDIQRRYPLA